MESPESKLIRRLERERMTAVKERDELRARLVRIRGIAAEPRPVNLTIRLANIVAVCDAPEGFSGGCPIDAAREGT